LKLNFCFQIVIENASDIDKISQMKELRKEFWNFPRNVGWKIPESFRNFEAEETRQIQINPEIKFAVPSDAGSI
jgi:hypothetical protein